MPTHSWDTVAAVFQNFMGDDPAARQLVTGYRRKQARTIRQGSQESRCCLCPAGLSLLDHDTPTHTHTHTHTHTPPPTPNFSILAGAIEPAGCRVHGAGLAWTAPTPCRGTCLRRCRVGPCCMPSCIALSVALCVHQLLSESASLKDPSFGSAEVPEVKTLLRGSISQQILTCVPGLIAGLEAPLCHCRSSNDR